MSPRIALFATCLGDQFFAEACADAVRLLRHLGADVDFPEEQTCCGQPAYNSGHRSEAERMARHTLRVFEDAEYVVTPSGSCAAMLRHEYPRLLPGAETRSLTEKVFELSEFVVDVLGVEQLGEGLTGQRVAYHHGCHALRSLGLSSQPVRLLEGAGAEVASWSDDRECCGFGGLFSTKLPEVSASMADRKLDTLPDVDVVTSADPGCLLQIGGRAERRRRALSVRHLASLLWSGVGR